MTHARGTLHGYHYLYLSQTQIKTLKNLHNPNLYNPAQNNTILAYPRTTETTSTTSPTDPNLDLIVYTRKRNTNMEIENSTHFTSNQESELIPALAQDRTNEDN